MLAQRLVRVVCDHCARTHSPTPHEYEWLRVELGDAAERHEFREGVGCSQCNGTGYAGRTGIYEMLEMTGRVVEAANHEDPTAFVRAAREQMAGHTLNKDALRVAMEGRTTVAEAMRVSSQSDE